MTPEEPYELSESIAIIGVTKSKLKKIKNIKTESIKRPPIGFYECGLKNGDELVYIEDKV